MQVVTTSSAVICNGNLPAADRRTYKCHKEVGRYNIQHDGPIAISVSVASRRLRTFASFARVCCWRKPDGERPRMLTNHSDKTGDGKSYVNPQTGVLSKAYERFVDPIDNGTRGG